MNDAYIHRWGSAPFLGQMAEISPEPGTPCSSANSARLHHGPSSPSQSISQQSHNKSSLPPVSRGTNNKRTRRPAGTPDPEAEVVSLSPKTLMESDRYVCEICEQGFQRDQNLQMHRRRHKVPWKLLKRETTDARIKRVFVCPEPTCLHHNPSHALGDLVGIKKHFRRKHSTSKQWTCEKCSKAYAVQSDYKAHLKTCGTRGHTCDCGRVFSRVESFIEHQDDCTATKEKIGDDDQLSMPCSFTRISSHNTFNAPETGLFTASVLRGIECGRLEPNWPSMEQRQELQLMPSKQQGASETSEFPEPYSKPSETSEFPEPYSKPSETSEFPEPYSKAADDKSSPRLQLSIGLGSEITENKFEEETEQQKQLMMRVAYDEMAYAEHVRRVARRQLELADIEFERAKKMREQAHAELDKARFLKDKATREIAEATITPLEITCRSCHRHFHWPLQYQSPSLSGFLSSISNLQAEGGADNENSQGKIFPAVSMMRYMDFSNPPVIEIDEGHHDKMQMSLFALKAPALIPSPSKPRGQLHVPVSRTVSSSVTSSTKIELN